MKLVDKDIAPIIAALGYDGERRAWIDVQTGDVETDSMMLYDWHFPAPRIDDVAYWLREKFGWNIRVNYSPYSGWFCDMLNLQTGEVFDVDDFRTEYLGKGRETYEDALEEGVKILLDKILDEEENEEN